VDEAADGSEDGGVRSGRDDCKDHSDQRRDDDGPDRVVGTHVQSSVLSSSCPHVFNYAGRREVPPLAGTHSGALMDAAPTRWANGLRCSAAGWSFCADPMHTFDPEEAAQSGCLPLVRFALGRGRVQFGGVRGGAERGRNRCRRYL